MTITKVIKALYVKLGGSLTDTISGIAGGIPVAEYTVISDCIKALYVLYGGDLSEVYSGISDVAVKDYTSISKVLAALAKVAFQGVMVDESYDISEGKLNTATVTLVGDVTAHIPDGVVTIGNTAFMNNIDITKVIIPNSVLTIEDGYTTWQTVGAFAGCISLTDIVFSKNLTKIASAMFGGCTALTSIVIPDNVTIIGDRAFDSCTSLTSITIPDGVTSIGNYTFDDCRSLTSITIPDSVTSIGEGAFNGCTSLTSITIPDSVTSIGNNAFSGCTSLTSITIPDSVTSIGNSAFYSCTSLTDIYYTGTQAEWEAITGISGAGIPAGATIHYEYTPS